MDLTQSKLTKTEWNNVEIPVSDQEKKILEMIKEGYQQVNIRCNSNLSLFQTLKIDVTPENELYLYKKYFEKNISDSLEKYKKKLKTPVNFAMVNSVSKTPKKADIIRIEYMDKTLESKKSKIFEFLLVDFCITILKSIANNTDKYIFALYTLIQLKKSTISHCNTYVMQFVDYMIAYTKQQVSISDVVFKAHELIEKNSYLLEYADMTLFQHQKQLFSTMKQTPDTPKLVLYIAPTGTGKTLSPIGLSEQYRVIFICVARHIGLALAKSAITMNKKIAFAFGCDTASDIRLHYFAASTYSVNKKSGSIAKVDNSVGDKVEIMICDVKSYLTAMHYMLAFNEEVNIVTYWDEPTITMDYPEHELHDQIHENWKQNQISKMVLSCATLPKENEIIETISDFREKFDMAEIHTIQSYDCRKSISILNKESRCVLPHTISDFSTYSGIMKCIMHCEENKTLLRYFDLNEMARYIKYINTISRKMDVLDKNYFIESYFSDITDITMDSVKDYYLKTFHHLDAEKWPHIHEYLMKTQEPKYKSVDQNPFTRTHSVNMAPQTKENNLTKLNSMNDALDKKPIGPSQSGILLTTNDAHTLTDGPTIFITEDVEKIGKFYIQSSKIPELVLDRIKTKLDKNTAIKQAIETLQNTLEDKMGSSKDDKEASNGKDRKFDRSEKMNPELRKIVDQIENMQTLLSAVHLDSNYVPNTNQHQQVWTNTFTNNAFVPNIKETVVKEIMELDVDNSLKILLLLGIGMFSNQPNIAYMEIMKRLAYEQHLYLIIASSDYIYGTNYSFCHGFLGKDLLNMTQQKIIQAIGRVGRNKIQQDYTVRFRDDSIIMKLFLPSQENLEAENMTKLFSST